MMVLAVSMIHADGNRVTVAATDGDSDGTYGEAWYVLLRGSDIPIKITCSDSWSKADDVFHRHCAELFPRSECDLVGPVVVGIWMAPPVNAARYLWDTWGHVVLDNAERSMGLDPELWRGGGKLLPPLTWKSNPAYGGWPVCSPPS